MFLNECKLKGVKNLGFDQKSDFGSLSYTFLNILTIYDESKHPRNSVKEQHFLISGVNNPDIKYFLMGARLRLSKTLISIKNQLLDQFYIYFGPIFTICDENKHPRNSVKEQYFLLSV